MAGGMGVRRAWPNLAERGRQTQAQRDGAGGGHCWVVDATASDVRHPGLLLEWRRHEGLWQGLVAFRRQGEIVGEYSLTQEWLDAERLRPAGDA